MFRLFFLITKRKFKISRKFEIFENWLSLPRNLTGSVTRGDVRDVRDTGLIAQQVGGRGQR